jgi:hypothetical protein
VAYFSKRHSPAECNYEIYDKELLVIIRAFEEWRPELEGSQEPVKVVTDHKNLEYFTTSKTLSRRQVRWSEFLSRFNFVISYRPGSQCKADALTRRSQDLPDGNEDERQQFMQQVLLKPKILSDEVKKDLHVSIKPIRILRRGEELPDLGPTDPVSSPDEIPLPRRHQDTPLEEEIELAYRQLAREDLLQVTRRQIMEGTRRSRFVTLADCHLENNLLFYRKKLWLPENTNLR